MNTSQSNSSFFSAFTINILFVVLVIIGIAVAPMIAIKLQPTHTLNTLSIQYYWAQAPARILEQEVTSKFEGALSTVNGIKNVTSISGNKNGSITIELDEDVNVNHVRYEIATIIRQIYPKLPLGLSYPSISANRASGTEGNRAILAYTVSGQGNSYVIQQFVEKHIKPNLALIKGISQINVYGATPNCWELKYNQDELRRLQITVEELSTAINNYLKQYELGNGYELDRKNPEKLNYTFLTLKSNRTDTLDWSQIPVKKSGSRIIYLTDLVKISLAEQVPTSFYRINGLNTVNIEVIAAKNSNYLVVANLIKEKIKEQSFSLPSTYSIIPAYDATDFLKKELEKITWRTVATVFILLLFVLIASRQIRYLLLIVISLLSNLFIAFILYYVLKLEINLYSLAGITVSMGMIIDNSIVMIDHIRHKNNQKVFLAVMGATLTTIGAVSIIFFLDEEQKVNLLDFAWVMIINLGISILIALFFIPALMEKIPLKRARYSQFIRRKRRIIRWTKLYSNFIQFSIRFRILYVSIIILLFGLPLFLLPVKIEKDGFWVNKYNVFFGSEIYNETIRPYVDKYLGGTLALFVNNSDQFNYSSEIKERTKINVNISMPHGASLDQMNQIVLSFENFLSQYNEIELYQSSVISGQNARIEISIKPAYEKNAFPFTLKSELESKAVYIGLAEFSISGVGQGFNNELNIENANYSLTLQGYNFDNLKSIAERVKKMLLENQRVEKVYISSTPMSWQGEKPNYEFVFNIANRERLIVNRFSMQMAEQALNAFSAQKKQVTNVLYHEEYIPVILSPIQTTDNIWNVMNDPVSSGQKSYVRLKDFATLEKEKIGDDILRFNQQYQLVVNYNFIGDYTLGAMVSDRIIKEISANLPLGYSIKEANKNFWRGAEEKLTWAIFLTIGIIFIICATLLNSIKQPLTVITLIPISFIGVFLASYFFEYKFDEGGYAAFLILCGVVVNASLFILNDYNNLLIDYPHKSKLVLFLKAYNSKIIPILLSITSMIIGLIPFIIYSKNETFWYALAVSTIGGLVFSLLATLIFLPMFLLGVGSKK